MFPEISTESKSWNPTSGILPAIITPTFRGFFEFESPG
jgi:hypothetical protein